MDFVPKGLLQWPYSDQTAPQQHGLEKAHIPECEKIKRKRSVLFSIPDSASVDVPSWLELLETSTRQDGHDHIREKLPQSRYTKKRLNHGNNIKTRLKPVASMPILKKDG